MTTCATVLEPSKLPEAGQGDQRPIPFQEPAERKCTDFSFFIAFVVCLLIMVPLCATFLVNCDFNRFFYGSDKYGNICGVKNKPIVGKKCSGQNLTHKTIVMLKYYNVNEYCLFSKKKILPDLCIERCDPPNQLIFNRCYPDAKNTELERSSKAFKQLTEVLHVICESMTTIIAMNLTALGLSLSLFILLRCHVIATFWGLFLFQTIASLTTAIFFWYQYFLTEEKSIIYLLFALGFMGYFAFIVSFLFIIHTSLRLIFRIYHDTLNIVFKMPLILLQPIITLCALVPLVAAVIFVIFLIVFTQCLKTSREYVINAPSLFYGGYLAFMILWIFAFGEGWQTMIVSGAIRECKIRDPVYLQSPLRKSFSNMIRYHLGTISCGSLLLTLFLFIRGLAEYVIRKVYMQTASQGQSFYKSLIRVIRLLRLDIVRTIAITGFNYLVICGFSLIIMMLTVGVGIWMNLETTFTHYTRLGILLGAVSASFLTYFVLQILHISTETIFLCYCEEQIRLGNGNTFYLPPRAQNTAELTKTRPTN